MKTVRRLLYRDIGWSVVFVGLAFLSLFFFIDFVDELEDVGRGSYTLARALLRTLAQGQLKHPDSPIAGHITLSGGITTCIPDETTTAEGLLMRADDALYNAKAYGRNRFFSYEMQMDTDEQRQSLRGGH